MSICLSHKSDVSIIQFIAAYITILQALDPVDPIVLIILTMQQQVKMHFPAHYVPKGARINLINLVSQHCPAT